MHIFCILAMLAGQQVTATTATKTDTAKPPVARQVVLTAAQSKSLTSISDRYQELQRQFDAKVAELKAEQTGLIHGFLTGTALDGVANIEVVQEGDKQVAKEVLPKAEDKPPPPTTSKPPEPPKQGGDLKK